MFVINVSHIFTTFKLIYIYINVNKKVSSFVLEFVVMVTSPSNLFFKAGNRVEVALAISNLTFCLGNTEKFIHAATPPRCANIRSVKNNKRTGLLLVYYIRDIL